VLGHNLAVLGKTVDEGVKVVLVYGDRDYQCNWYGGEPISLAMESHLSREFRKAGYAEIRTEEKKMGAKGKVGGVCGSMGGCYSQECWTRVMRRHGISLRRHIAFFRGLCSIEMLRRGRRGMKRSAR
jgi:hypothetical protein